MLVRKNYDSELYNWELENYEALARECFSIKSIPHNKIRNYLLASLVQKIFDKKVCNYPTLILSDNDLMNNPTLRYKEKESPPIHINEVTKNIGEQG